MIEKIWNFITNNHAPNIEQDSIDLFNRINLGDTSAVELIINSYSDHDIVKLFMISDKYNGYFPLHLICERNNRDMFDLIKDRITQEDLVKLLIMRDNLYGMTPLSVAIEMDNIAMFFAIRDCLSDKQFIEIINSAVFNEKYKHKNKTLLQYAFEKGNAFIIREVINSLLREGNNEKSKRAREKVINMVLERREDGDLEITHAFRNAIRMEEEEKGKIIDIS